MRYFGGKARIAKHIVPILKQHREEGSVYVEPFVGGGSIFCSMDGPKVGFDVVPELVELLEMVRDGWEPPENITRRQYELAKSGEISGHLRAFIGFGCSFGGKWFGGFAQSKDRNYATNARNSLLKKAPGLNGEFAVKSFFDLDCSGCLVYCDPPYEGTTPPGSRCNFDSDKFWEHAQHLAQNNKVFVSEQSVPEGAKVVWESVVKTDMQSQNRKRHEKLVLL